MPKFILNMLIGFVIRALVKWGEAIDWALVKQDAAERIRALVPGIMFDDEVVKLANLLFDAAAKITGEAEAIQNIVELMAAGKFDEALLAMKHLILGALPVPAVASADVDDALLSALKLS